MWLWPTIAGSLLLCHPNPVPTSPTTHTYISRDTKSWTVIPSETYSLVLLCFSINFSSYLEDPPFHPCPFGKSLFLIQVSSKVLLIEEMFLDTPSYYFLMFPQPPLHHTIMALIICDHDYLLSWARYSLKA